jgi:methionyl-tRNA formyltransferase
MREASPRVVFMGTSEFGVPALERLVQSEYEVAAVYTQPDRPAGRGRVPSSSPVKRAALEHGLEIRQPVTLRERSEVELLAALEPEAIVVSAYGLLLPQSVLDIPKFGCLNIHPSLLPKYRGPTPVASAILAGDSETGITIMLLDAGMDTGPTLSQIIVGIEAEDTAASLTARLAAVGARLLAETIELWLGGSLTAQPQDESLATYTKMFVKDDGVIDWHLGATEIWRRVRAFDPWPGSYTMWRGKSLKVLEAVPLEGGRALAPGRVVDLPAGQPAPVGVETGDGVLGLVRVQLEGKRATPVAEFVRGQRGFVGDVLGEG